MSSISPIRPVINNSTSARPTQTDKCARGPSPRGINEEGNGYISGRPARLLSRGRGASPRARLSAVHCWLLPGQVQIVPSPFISASPAENLKGRDKIHLRRAGADCLEQVL